MDDLHRAVRSLAVIASWVVEHIEDWPGIDEESRKVIGTAVRSLGESIEDDALVQQGMSIYLPEPH